MQKTLLTLAAASLVSVSAQAEQYWSDTSISILNGSDYEFAADEDITTMTLEHVSGHSWGNLFFFQDRHKGGAYSESYGEFSPSFTLTKLSDDGFFKDINAAFTYEFGTTQGGQSLDNYLFGIGSNLNVPGLDYASATVYMANNEEYYGNSKDYQLTVVFGYSNGNFGIDGFMDYAFNSDNDSTEDSMNFTPQITYNIGPMLGTDNKVKVGIEYSYWTSQFGIDGQDQNAVSLLLKAHL